MKVVLKMRPAIAENVALLMECEVVGKEDDSHHHAVLNAAEEELVAAEHIQQVAPDHDLGRTSFALFPHNHSQSEDLQTVEVISYMYIL